MNRKNDLLLFELPLRLSGTMEVDVIASILNMSLDEIKQHIKKEKPLFKSVDIGKQAEIQ